MFLDRANGVENDVPSANDSATIFAEKSGMEPVRWGILGAAKFARQFMGPAIHAADGAELTALATSSEEKVAGF